MTNEQMAEAMIEKFLEHCNQPWDPELSVILDRSWILEYRQTQLAWDNDDTRIIHLSVSVADELGHLQLLGVFEEEQLVHLTSEVDTSWREVGYAEFPSGLINEDNPWKRTWKFTSTP